MKKLIIMLLILLLPTLLSAQNLSRIKLKTVSGKQFVMKNNLQNDATIILFWATWCIPCKKEFKAIQKLIDKYPDKTIEVITISQDTPRSISKVKSFVRSHSYKFTFLLDPNKDIATKHLINSVPYSIILDKKGKVIFSHSGYLKGDEIELEKQLLKYWEQSKE